ncbi:hypothetical protein F4779DRAFT_614468 [Xylariaceae sp. FL0662B]|nr:hypothetical protein F4779DRAFT_614468 [Xylariaceae sp. FL0662B]
MDAPPPFTSSTTTTTAASSSQQSSRHDSSAPQPPPPAAPKTPSTDVFIRDLNLVAEAAKRAQMALLTRDLEGVALSHLYALRTDVRATGMSATALEAADKEDEICACARVWRIGSYRRT